MSHKVIIIPGNGNSDVSNIWIPYVKTHLEEKGIQVIAKNMPDPDLARKEYWLPFMKKELQADEETIAIGHSSGALAIMRFLEEQRLFGAILVGACYTDLGDENEQKSGYYDTPWQWETIKKNAQWIAQFASQDDPYIPISEARYIHEHLNCEYHEYTDQGHFGSDKEKTEFPEIVSMVLRRLSL